MNSDLIELLEAFEKGGVKYLIIGGYAVGYHVEPRYTKDCDLWIATDAVNAAAIHRALIAFHAPLHGATAKDFQDENAFFSFGAPPNRVDILMGPPGGVPFDEAWRRRVTDRIGDVPVHFVSREDLVALKKAAGRPIDRRDLKALAESAPPPANTPARKASARKPVKRAAPKKKP